MNLSLANNSGSLALMFHGGKQSTRAHALAMFILFIRIINRTEVGSQERILISCRRTRAYVYVRMYARPL